MHCISLPFGDPMANVVVPDACLVECMLRMMASDVHYHLFTNPLGVSKSTVLGDFTECAMTGYAPVNVAAADWVVSGVVAHRGFVATAPITFTASAGGPNNIYGYFVTDVADAVLLWCITWDASRTFTAGVNFDVNPIFGDFSTYP